MQAPMVVMGVVWWLGGALGASRRASSRWLGGLVVALGFGAGFGEVGSLSVSVGGDVSAPALYARQPEVRLIGHR